MAVAIVLRKLVVSRIFPEDMIWKLPRCCVERILTWMKCNIWENVNKCMFRTIRCFWRKLLKTSIRSKSCKRFYFRVTFQKSLSPTYENQYKQVVKSRVGWGQIILIYLLFSSMFSILSFPISQYYRLSSYSTYEMSFESSKSEISDVALSSSGFEYLR
jgi:hypothetical protein